MQQLLNAHLSLSSALLAAERFYLQPALSLCLKYLWGEFLFFSFFFLCGASKRGTKGGERLSAAHACQMCGERSLLKKQQGRQDEREEETAGEGKGSWD